MENPVGTEYPYKGVPMKIITLDESEIKIRYRYNPNGTASGFVLFEYYNEPWRSGWHLELMRIVPERCGNGTRILKTALSDLKKRGILHITVQPTNDKSKAFFQKNGFVAITGDTSMFEINI